MYVDRQNVGCYSRLIISQFRNLEQLGYRAMAFGFFEDDAQAASTSDCTMVLQPKFVKQSSQGLLQVLLICPLIFVSIRLSSLAMVSFLICLLSLLLHFYSKSVNSHLQTASNSQVLSSLAMVSSLICLTAVTFLF